MTAVGNNARRELTSSWPLLLAEADEGHLWLARTKAELRGAKLAWQKHGDVLSAMDEMAAYASTMRLAPPGEVSSGR